MSEPSFNINDKAFRPVTEDGRGEIGIITKIYDDGTVMFSIKGEKGGSHLRCPASTLRPIKSEQAQQ